VRYRPRCDVAHTHPCCRGSSGNAITNKQYENVYILWGLHLSTLLKVAVKSDSKIFDALVMEYLSWVKKIETTPDQEVKRNSIPIARFLSEEIARRFTGERLDAIKDLDPTRLDEEERAPHGIADEFSRGATELEIE
jgi:hypothetical protein